MSNIYIQEPPTTGKVMMKTTVGDIDIELWTKETPKACRNFIQLCIEGYYDDTIFHRIIKGFIAQGGDPTGTGEGGESIYGHPFKDEFHSRLRFCRRGLIAMANAGKDDNGAQFFFTLGQTPELQNKHTIFGKVTGETIFNMLKLEEALVDKNDRPLYPPKILKTEVLNNPFQDIVPRKTVEETEVKKEKKSKRSGIKNFNLLSFGKEAEEDEEESAVLNKQYSGKGKSAHDHSVDAKLSAQPAIEPAGPPSKKLKEDRSSDWESDTETHTPEELATIAQRNKEMKQRIKDKLNSGVKRPNTKNIQHYKVDDDDDGDDETKEKEEEEEEYYIGKEKDDERKKKLEAFKKEVRDLKHDISKRKKTEEILKKQETKKNEKDEKSELFKEYLEIQEKYKEKESKVPKKGRTQEDFTFGLFKKFCGKLKEHTKEDTDNTNSNKITDPKTEEKKETEDDNLNDESWMKHVLRCEEKAPILAKDASTKDDDWFEIYDPRNPLNKRRRGEKSNKSRDERESKRRAH